MAVVTTDPLLDHLEQTFAESYRKEIDQEENVWRSLPFFAATLALQLTGLAQGAGRSGAPGANLNPSVSQRRYQGP